MKTNALLAIGLMSGTSMDGIDAAIIETNGYSHITSIGHYFLPYDANFQLILKVVEFAVNRCQGNLIQAKEKFSEFLVEYLRKINFANEHELFTAKISLSEVIQRSTELHLQAIVELLKQTGVINQQIAVIGYHGQTVFHQPSLQISLQLGDAKYLAQQTQISVVHDFRQNDLLNGGQGAPLAPIYHQALALRDNLVPSAVVNCGGIANVTFIQGTKTDDLLGFDTGPGNTLLDRFVQQRTKAQEFMDRDGQHGLQGKVCENLLTVLMQKSCQKDYLNFQPPKSLDVNDLLLPQELDNYSLADGCATLAAFTARTILDSADFTSTKIDKWILAGGGWHNPVIYRELTQYAKQKFSYPVKILRCEEVGWNNAALEAELFAYLAMRCLNGLPISFPTTTNVAMPLMGGMIYEPSQKAK